VLSLWHIVAQFIQEVLCHPGGSRSGGENTRWAVSLAVLALSGVQEGNFPSCSQVFSYGANRVLVHANQFSQEAVRLARVPPQFIGDQVTPLLARQLPP